MYKKDFIKIECYTTYTINEEGAEHTSFYDYIKKKNKWVIRSASGYYVSNKTKEYFDSANKKSGFR